MRKAISGLLVILLFLMMYKPLQVSAVSGFYFRSSMSENVLRQYVSRAVTLSGLCSVGVEEYPIFEEDLRMLVRFGAFPTDGRYAANIKKEIILAGNASTVIECVEYPTADGEQIFIFASLYNKDNELVARTRYNNLKYSELQLQPSQISVKKIPDGYVLSSDVFTMGVCLGLDGDEQTGDNMFDLFPGQPYSVQAAGLPDSPVLYDLNTFLKSKYGD